GNVSEYLDSSGQTVAHFEYDPFGRLLDTMPLVSEDLAIKQALSYRFSTKPINFATGLYYYGYRWYDPQTGRWPSRDPIEEGGGDNIYGFVGNASAYEIDALGMFTSSSPYESVGEAHRLSISIPTLYAPRIPPTPLAPPLPIWWDATFGFDGLNAEGIAQCVRCPDGKSRIWKEGNFSFEWSASAGIQVGIPNISVGGATLFIGGRVEGKITGNLGIQCHDTHIHR
ncbi:MAG: RHS repeat-associated core domain-containing protein, partial [Sphingobacteriales bacterium]